MISAVVASNASISRNSLFSKPFTLYHFQFFPPLVVLPTVPLLPLTQTTLSFTTLKPRRLVLVPEVSTSTTGKDLCAQSNSLPKRNADRRKKIFLRSLILTVFRSKIIKHYNEC